MKNYVTYDPEGRIHYSITNLPEDEALLSVVDGQALFEIGDSVGISQDKQFILNGSLTNRPPPPELPSTAVAPWVIPLNSLASGAVVTVSREYGTDIVIVDLSEIWDIEDAGTYLIQIEQPFPYHRVTQEIVIEAATSGGL